jgi:hypothetical protein
VTETELLITQIGLLLSQTRFARRTLEDIERETATYGTFAFTSVIAAGPRFGAPPLIDGALKVHVVNISDLGPGGGFGALIEGLLGGAGRFVGNLVGGFAGGVVGTAWLLVSLPRIERIARTIERILGALGMTAPAPAAAPAAGAPAADTRGTPVVGSNLVTMLETINRAVEGLTGLFLAAGGRPEQAAAASNLPNTPEGDRWKRLLDSASVTLTAVSRVVDGLIIMMPIALGSIAMLVMRLGDIRLGIAETLQFVLRNALLLRGAITVLLFNTLAMVARVAASTVQILVTTLADMLSLVFSTIHEGLLAVLQLAGVVGTAVSTTVQALLDWIIPTIDTVLRDFGNSRVFRVITHVVRILPAILPPIYQLATDSSMPSSMAADLSRAGRLPFLDVVRTPRGATSPGTPAVPAIPDFGAIFTAPATINPLRGSFDRLQQVTRDGLTATRDSAVGGLSRLAGRLDAAAIAESRLSSATLDTRLGEVREHSTALAANLIVPDHADPQTGLEAVARAYEGWLQGGGMRDMLGTITRHFQSGEGRAGLPRHVVQGATPEPRAAVQIDEVVIDLDPGRPPVPAPAASDVGDFPLPPEGDDIERFARMWRNFHIRVGGRTDLLTDLA